jgi:hypothetical protein
MTEMRIQSGTLQMAIVKEGHVRQIGRTKKTCRIVHYRLGRCDGEIYIIIDGVVPGPGGSTTARPAITRKRRTSRAACPPRRIRYPVQSERDISRQGLCHGFSRNRQQTATFCLQELVVGAMQQTERPNALRDEGNVEKHAAQNQ